MSLSSSVYYMLVGLYNSETFNMFRALFHEQRNASKYRMQFVYVAWVKTTNIKNNENFSVNVTYACA